MTTRKASSLIYIIFLSLSVMSSASAELVGDTLPKISGKALVSELQKGGYVIYFRHGVTGKRGEKSVSPEKIADCTIQRNLSETGVAQTKAIGKAMRNLQIPIANVLSSPYCRCMDTAKNIFGKANASENLYFAIHLKKQDRGGVTKKLRAMLAEQPASGKNTALVSHTANLREAVNIWPKPEGVAHIFKPHGDGKFSYVGMVKPQEWIKLSN